MFKLVKIPDKLTYYVEGFRDLFTKPSHKSFSQMIAAISVCTKSKTVYNLYETMADDCNDKKARSTYDWFFNHAKWDEDEVAQRKAEMFFEALDLKERERILLIIDDTYREKKGECTDGVGSFFDHSKGYIWGNSFVTSVLQCRGLFIPHKAKMYIKEEDANKEGLEFSTKPQIAFEDIIKPLKIPETTKLMIVFDSWWFSADLINKVRGLRYNITCQIKSDKKIIPEDGSSLQVQEYAKRFKKDDHNQIKIMVRGKKKSYSVVERLVELENIGKVKLIISGKNWKDVPRYYVCTDTTLSAAEILSIYEDRWNIETGHRESNQKLGFKDYQMRSKKAIERFIQLVFAVWTALLLMELENEANGGRSEKIGGMVDKIRTSGVVDLIKEILDHFNLPHPDGLLDKVRRMGFKT